MVPSSDVQDDVQAFRETVAEWGPLVLRNARRANRLFDRYRTLARRLQSTREGRKALSRLTDDPNPYVRLIAGGRCLAWDPDRGRRTLELLDASGGPGSFSARMTLEEFDKGNYDPSA